MIPTLPAVRRAAAASLLCGALVLSACSSGDSGGSTTTKAPTPVDTGKVLTAIVDDQIVPSYEALGTSLDDLDAATAALCASSDGEAHSAAVAASRSSSDVPSAS